MKVRDLDGKVVEIPQSNHISPLRHIEPGQKIPGYHQWPETVITQRGWNGRQYYDAAYFYQATVFFPL